MDISPERLPVRRILRIAFFVRRVHRGAVRFCRAFLQQTVFGTQFCMGVLFLYDQNTLKKYTGI